MNPAVKALRYIFEAIVVLCILARLLFPQIDLAGFRVITELVINMASLVELCFIVCVQVFLLWMKLLILPMTVFITLVEKLLATLQSVPSGVWLAVELILFVAANVVVGARDN